MRATTCIFLLSLAICISTAAEDEGSARLLISKNILNQYLVEGKDLTVEYKIYNVGSSAALDIQLSDQSFPETDFEIIQGFTQVSWDRIAPGFNVTHAVILRPVKSGYFNFTAAEVSYQASEDSQHKTTGYTSSPGEGVIINIKEFERRFSPHVLDWAVFAVMTLPSLGIPFMLWYGSKKKFDAYKTIKRN